MGDDGLISETLDTGRSAAASVKLPAIFLLSLACMGVLAAIIGIFWSPDLSGSEMTEDQRQAIATLTGTMKYLFGGVFLVLNGAIAFGALKMMNLQSRGLAMIACVLALVNLQCGCLTFPFGVWGLMVLNDERVKAGFDRAATDGL